jgi:amino acid permease
VKPGRINPGVWITIFLVTVVAINYFGVRFFGEVRIIEEIKSPDWMLS